MHENTHPQFLVVISRRSHPIPSRTRKLSSLEPMVLLGRPSGRVGRRQDLLWPAQRKLRGLFLFVLRSPRMARSSISSSGDFAFPSSFERGALRSGRLRLQDATSECLGAQRPIARSASSTPALLRERLRCGSGFATGAASLRERLRCGSGFAAGAASLREGGKLTLRPERMTGLHKVARGGPSGYVAELSFPAPRAPRGSRSTRRVQGSSPHDPPWIKVLERSDRTIVTGLFSPGRALLRYRCPWRRNG